MIDNRPENEDLNSQQNNQNQESEKPSLPQEIQVEPDQPDEALQQKKGNVVQDVLKLFFSLKDFLTHILNIKDGADIPGTIEGIKKDIDFTGHKAWILILSILIASIGLNVNSTAVIIGAMLISPLMGPILGAGLAVGVNDPETFSRSIRNLATAVGISLVTSTLFFLISPFDTADSELLARTKPTLFDILIAFFGGAAGIIAGSRSEKSNVVPGVAIATALMPPLCTAGFGLANGDWRFFAGAFYLFLLNSIFIWLATYLVVRFINFPKVKFIDPAREKRYKQYIILSICIIIIPSGYIFWGVLQERIFESRAKSFITDHIKFEKTVLSSYHLDYESDPKSIDLILIGKPISKERIFELNMQLASYGLEKVKLNIAQNEEKKVNESEFQIAIYASKEEQIFKQDSIIKLLESRINELKSDTLPLSSLEQEMKVIQPKLTSFSYAPLIESNLEGKRDTVPTFLIVWEPSMDMGERASGSDELEKWLRVRLKKPKIKVITY